MMITPFDPALPLADSFRQSVTSSLDAAIALIDEPTLPPDEVVHEVRKLTKELRALLRLTRFSMRRSAWRQEMTDLREAAAALSGKREAHVMLATFDGLAAALQDPTTLGAIREALAQKAEQQAADSSLERARERLLAVRERAADWALRGDGFALIERGLRRLYADTRTRMFIARTEGGTIPFHAWRRANKQLMHAVQLLSASWPEAQTAWIERAHAVSDDLGDDHDLMSLRRELRALPESLAAGAASALGLVAQRSGELRVRSLALGAPLMAEKPGAFVRRQLIWWEAVKR